MHGNLTFEFCRCCKITRTCRARFPFLRWSLVLRRSSLADNWIVISHGFLVINVMSVFWGWLEIRRGVCCTAPAPCSDLSWAGPMLARRPAEAEGRFVSDMNHVFLVAQNVNQFLRSVHKPECWPHSLVVKIWNYYIVSSCKAFLSDHWDSTSRISGSYKLQDVERVEERDASCHCSRHTLEDKGAG